MRLVRKNGFGLKGFAKKVRGNDWHESTLFRLWSRQRITVLPLPGEIGR
jgi:DNA transposition AAA+ family ATPase